VICSGHCAAGAGISGGCHRVRIPVARSWAAGQSRPVFSGRLTRGHRHSSFCREFVDSCASERGTPVHRRDSARRPRHSYPSSTILRAVFALVVVGFRFRAGPSTQRSSRPIRTALPPAFEPGHGRCRTTAAFSKCSIATRTLGPVWPYEEGAAVPGRAERRTWSLYSPNSCPGLASPPVVSCRSSRCRAAYRQVGDDDTAIWRQSRRAPTCFNIAAGCPTPELYAADRAWVRAFLGCAGRPFASGSGSYVNLFHGRDRWRIASPPPAYGTRRSTIAWPGVEKPNTIPPQHLFGLNANVQTRPPARGKSKADHHLLADPGPARRQARAALLRPGNRGPPKCRCGPSTSV